MACPTTVPKELVNYKFIVSAGLEDILFVLINFLVHSTIIICLLKVDDYNTSYESNKSKLRNSMKKNKAIKI